MNNLARYLIPLVLAFIVIVEAQLPAPVKLSPAQTAFLDELEERTFRWFWETTNPANGLVPDRAPNPPFASIAAVGFGLTAYPVGAERGYITRAQAAERVLATLRFFWNAPQGEGPSGYAGSRGFFYHFLNMNTGLRAVNSELSTIDTGLLMAGVLFCQSYFDRPDPAELEIRTLADALYRRVEWTWFARDHAPLMTMSWRPERGLSRHAYRGYNEAMILYLLALGSPTHPIDTSVWSTFTSTYDWQEHYGEEFIQFGPLFGHQYSHVWVDFRGIQDAYTRARGIDYFENSRRATRSQRRYAADNPGRFRDYSDTIWGWTACDGPKDTTFEVDGRPVRFHGYWARGVRAGHPTDDGTLAPTAAGGSIPFEPDLTINTLMAMKERYGSLLYNDHGFLDAFNPSFRGPGLTVRRGTVDAEHGWFDDQHLGIDQGPIVLMAENFRSELVWTVMKKNPYIVRGLRLAGFQGGWLESISP